MAIAGSIREKQGGAPKEVTSTFIHPRTAGNAFCLVHTGSASPRARCHRKQMFAEEVAVLHQTISSGINDPGHMSKSKTRQPAWVEPSVSVEVTLVLF